MAHEILEQRNRWLVEVPGDELLSAAKQKADFHTARAAHWRQEADKQRADLDKVFAAAGIAPGMPIPPQYGNSTIQNVQYTAEHSAVQHREQAEHYERFVRLIERRIKNCGGSGASFSLNFSDLDYFGL